MGAKCERIKHHQTVKFLFSFSAVNVESEKIHHNDERIFFRFIPTGINIFTHELRDLLCFFGNNCLLSDSIDA